MPKEYICPMHPQIRQSNPGSCPICGMNLEPTMASDNEEDPELKYMTKRFWIGVLLTFPIIILVILEKTLIDHFISMIGIPLVTDKETAEFLALDHQGKSFYIEKVSFPLDLSGS